jgi:hypothetical protein
MGQLVLNGRALVWCDAAAGATTRGARRRKTSTCLRRSSLASTSSSSSCWCHAYAFLALAPCLLRPCEPWRAGLVVGCFRQARRSDALALLRDKVQADSDFNLAKHVCHVHQFNRYVLRGVFTEPWPGACEVASVAPGRRHAKMPGCIFGGLASLACILACHDASVARPQQNKRVSIKLVSNGLAGGRQKDAACARGGGARCCVRRGAAASSRCLFGLPAHLRSTWTRSSTPR